MSILERILSVFGYVKLASVAAQAAGELCPAGKLRELLSDTRYRFRKLATLAAAIGENEGATIGYLVSIGARQARGNASLWRLEPSASVASVADHSAKLRELLSDSRFTWRKLATLAAGIGKSESETVSELYRIGAKHARGNASLWQFDHTQAAACVADDSQRATLRELLSDSRYRFRKLATLAAATGLTESELAADVLPSIGARPEYHNASLWGLSSRVGAGRSASVADDEDDYDSDEDDYDSFDEDEDDYN